MKTHLPKAILAAIMAIPSLAVAEVNNNWTWANKTETDPITCSGLNYQMAPSAIVEVPAGEVTTYTNDNIPSAWKNASTVTDRYGSHVQPFLKDGDGTLEISGIKGAEGESVSIGSPLYVREGTATITGCNIIAGAAFTTSQLMLGVSGKNANLELIDTTYANDGDISTKYIGVGGPDGSGTLTLSGNTTVTAWTMFAGRSRTNTCYRAVTSTTDTTAADSGRYAGGVYTDTGLFYGTDNNGDGVGDTPRIYGKATVNVNTGSKMHLWNQVDASEAEINVNGGTIQADEGILLGMLNGSSSELNITYGGKVITTNYGLYTGDQLTSTTITQYDTTVTVSGEGSELNVTGVKLGYTTANDTADRKSQTTLKVTDGATVTAGYISLGRADGSTNDAGKVDVEVGHDAKLTATNTLSLLAGAKVTNSGTITVAEDTDIIGGSTTTLAGGVTNFEGNVTVTGGEFATGHSQIPTVQKWRTEGVGCVEKRLSPSYTGEQVAGGIINFGGDTSVVQIKDATFQSGGEMNFSGSSISVENASFETLAAPDKDTAWSTVSYVPEYYTNADGNYTDSEGNVLADGAEPIVKQYIKTTVKNAYTDGAMSFNGDVVAKSGSTFTATAGEMNFNGSLTAETGSKITSNTDATITMGSLTLNGGSFTSNGELIADTITLSSGELVLGDASTLTLMVDNTAALIFGDAEVLKLATDATMVHVKLIINDISTYSLRSASTDLILAEGNETQANAFYALLDDENVTITYVDAEGKELEGYSMSTSGGKIVIENETNAVPEPTTATLSLLALAGLCARRRRR